MVAIERITRENIELFKSVRLDALNESPSAFGSTYAREAAFTHTEWLARLERWNGEQGIGFLAMDGGKGCGIAGALLDLEDPARAQLVSMWTAPAHRRRGAGQLLVGAVIDWAKSRKIKTLTLMVVSTNGPAIRFYEQLGFAKTGRTDPYPNDPTIVEYEMSRALS
ncbi:MAG TPA: GNAT family N-acetyltransferase [Candidatus Acidoferrum sp.]|nr:GNAT family N-acetyltransferase [Candidatus Acidoferrum sp.]